MSPARLLAFPVIAAAVVAAGCGPKRQPAIAAVPPPPPALIALLQDPGTQVTGRARVSNEFGAADLTTERAATRVTANAAPGSVTTLSAADVTRFFGEALAGLPPAPQHFILQFRFESDTLTAESAALVPEILTAVKALSVPEVVIVGHTDTMGDRKANLALGFKRANTVRGILTTAGLAGSTIEVTSHGEADLRVRTRNNTPEPRNRRVEITVR